MHRILAILVLSSVGALAQIPGPLNPAWWGEDGVATHIQESASAHWKFEETASATRVDSASTNNLFIIDALHPINTDTGKLGSSGVILVADSDYALVQTNHNFNFKQSDFSINFWYKDHSGVGASQANWVCGVYNVTGDKAWAVVMDNNQPSIKFFTNLEAVDTYTYDTPIGDMNYHMVTITFDSTSGDLGNLKIYVDNGGSPLTSNGITGPDNIAGIKFVVGNASDISQASTFTLDSLSIWKGKVLSAGEITTLYNGGAGKDYPFGF